jgi:hypothetical protein
MEGGAVARTAFYVDNAIVASNDFFANSQSHPDHDIPQCHVNDEKVLEFSLRI